MYYDFSSIVNVRTTDGICERDLHTDLYNDTCAVYRRSRYVAASLQLPKYMTLCRLCDFLATVSETVRDI